MEDTKQLLMRKAKVVGQHFARQNELAAQALDQLEQGDMLTIRHTPENEYDHYAAAVFMDDILVGHIQADISPVLCVLNGNGLNLFAEITQMGLTAGNFFVEISMELKTETTEPDHTEMKY